jgi:hypothetical protein
MRREEVQSRARRMPNKEAIFDWPLGEDGRDANRNLEMVHEETSFNMYSMKSAKSNEERPATVAGM